jgi:RNA polymerase sigma-70 factor (ECF subfamily)
MPDDETFSFREPDTRETLFLLGRAREGSREALEDLFRRYRVRLERWIACRLGPSLRRRLDVEDVVQETLAAAYQSLDGFKATSPESFRNWILSIAENRIRDAHDYFHAKKRDPEREQELDSRYRDAITSPSMRVARKEGHERILEVLASLKESHREVVRLVKFEGLSYKEAGTRLDISPKNVSVRLVRALKALREGLNAEDWTSQWR